MKNNEDNNQLSDILDSSFDNSINDDQLAENETIDKQDKDMTKDSTLKFENNGLIILYEENNKKKYNYLYFKNINFHKMDDNKYEPAPSEELMKLYSLINDSSSNNVNKDTINIIDNSNLDPVQKDNLKHLQTVTVSDLIKKLTKYTTKSDSTIVYVPIYQGIILTVDYLIKDLSHPIILKSIKRKNKLGMELSTSFINSIIQNAGLGLPSLSTITNNNHMTFSGSNTNNIRFPIFSNRPNTLNQLIQTPNTSLDNQLNNTIEGNDGENNTNQNTSNSLNDIFENINNSCSEELEIDNNEMINVNENIDIGQSAIDSLASITSSILSSSSSISTDMSSLEEKYKTQIEQMKLMGFTDETKIINALAICEGNLEHAINYYLN
jgi:hypothetical protein